MAAKKRKEPTKTAMKKREKLYIRLFYLGIFLWVMKAIFFSAVTIGHDSRYFIFVFLIPVLAGLMGQFLLWRKSVMGDIRETKGVFGKIKVSLLYLCIGIFCSYISAGLVAESAWETANRQAAAVNPEETMEFTVTRFRYGKNAAIEFRFRNRSEHINTNSRSIAAYKNSAPGRYSISLEVQKGIWGYYIVNSWHVADSGNGENN
ncbi:MAG: hypothetical protein U0V75_02620 [Ferruginibacter sp.]